MRYYLIAGERSGDQHGEHLIHALKKKDLNGVFRGFGGHKMEGAGMHLTNHYNQLSYMGFVAIAIHFRKIWKLIQLCKNDILQFKPDVVIFIDFGGFNNYISKFTKGNQIKSFYYIPPKIWAWYQSRAKKMKENVNKLFVILPFEKEFYKKIDWDVDYVGSPVLDVIKTFKVDPNFINRLKLTNNKPIVALLPGSRPSELKKMVTLMKEVILKNNQYQFVVAAVDGLAEYYNPLRKMDQVKIVHDDTYNLLAHAQAAVVTSGTATLETGLMKVPQVCVYKIDWLEMKIAKMLVKVKHISLINLIAGKEAIKELIQRNATEKAISKELDRLVFDLPYRAIMILEYEMIFQTLDVGVASENAAHLMTKYLNTLYSINPEV